MPKQAEAKRDGVINPQNYNFNQFKTRKILMLSKRYESTEVDRRTWLLVPSGTHWSTSSDTAYFDWAKEVGYMDGAVSAKFIGPSDRQDKYVNGPICLISSRTELSNVVSNTLYIIYTQSQTDRSSVLWNDSPNRTECPMKFHKVSRTLMVVSPI